MTIRSKSNLASNLTRTAAAFLMVSLGACGEMTESNNGSLTGSAAPAPSLGAAASFAVLGASTVTCTGPSAVTGDVGVSPGTGITGFNPPCTITGTIHAGDAAAAQAHADLGIAYGALAGAACEHNLTGQDLGGQTLAPGVWIFQVGTAITTATNASVVMAGSGTPGNVFWQVGSSATIGTATAFQGNLVAYATVTLVSGSSIVGRALALNAAVTLDNNSISVAN
jgi:type VI secretion system secreted protein VgrG